MGEWTLKPTNYLYMQFQWFLSYLSFFLFLFVLRKWHFLIIFRFSLEACIATCFPFVPLFLLFQLVSLFCFATLHLWSSPLCFCMSEKMEYVRPSSISPSVTLTLLVVWSVIKVLDSSSGGSNGVSNDTYVVGIGISGEAIVNLFFF